MSNINLSICIPAYNYPDGIYNLLKKLADTKSEHFEIIISDASTNDEVKEVCDEFLNKYNSKIKYFKYSGEKTAVANWNFVLSKAKGVYLILFHHDECPLEKNFIDILEKLFLENKAMDLLVLRSLKLINNKNYFREHYPIWLKKLFIYNQPEYILKRNFLGPTASVVYKKELLIKYDPNLVWFIDIDMYFRLLQKCNSILFTNKASVFSEEYKKSITNQIKIKLKKIIKIERKYLDQKYSSKNLWWRKKYFGNYLNSIDKTIWILIKLFIKLLSKKYKK